MTRYSVAVFSLLLLMVFVVVFVAPDTAAQTTDLVINEILPGNASTNLDTDFYEYASWIELYNGGTSTVDLQGYSLSYLDYNADTPLVWTVPTSLVVPAKGWVILWADEEDELGTHASFELDMRGSEIRLLAPSGDVLDVVQYDMRDDKTLLPDISYGRQTEGSSSWVYFDRPTPAAANHTAGQPEPTLAEAPTFTPAGGVYSGEQIVSLLTAEALGDIRYTTDGSIPSESSTLYTGAITVTSPTVVRARVFTPQKLASPTASHTFLIDVQSTLPVVSLATKPAHLFDDVIGIYVAGTNGITGRCSDVPVNWNQPWERPASMEMYETDGSQIVAQDVGFEIFGGCTRLFPRKSLEIKARRTYGDNDIDFPVLPDKPIESYKRLILRNSGNDARATQFRDALQHYLVKDMMDIDYQAYRPVVLFINGAYWGIHNLRDKADEAFVEQNYDLDADSEFDMIEGQNEILAGNSDAWRALHDFIQANDLRETANYEKVKSEIDLEAYMNYMITEIYVNNGDWPNSNIRYWRAYENGQWRWLLYDLDAGFSITHVNRDLLAFFLTCQACPPGVEYHVIIFRKLMENPNFRNDFAQRFASHINISFDPERVNSMIDLFKARIEPEMPAHIARWRTPATMEAWNARIDSLRKYGNQRPAIMLGQLDTYLGSPGTGVLTVEINGAGEVFAAGVKTPSSGYSGHYIRHMPLTLEAVPQHGWLFGYWLETGSRDSTTTIELSGDMTRTAVFKEAVDIFFVPVISSP